MQQFLKINLVTISCTNGKEKNKNSYQQQIHHGNQGQEMAAGPFSHHRRKRFFSTYERYKKVESTVVNRQLTGEPKHEGARSLLTLAEKSRHWTAMTKMQFFKEGMRHIWLENKIYKYCLPLWKSSNKIWITNLKWHLNGSLQLQIGLELQIPLKLTALREITAF